MKIYLSLLAFLLINNLLFAQNNHYSSIIKMDSSPFFEFSKYHPKASAEFLLDSIYDFDGSNLPDSEWSSFHKEIIAERTTNGLPILMFYIYDWYESGLSDTMSQQMIEYPDIYDADHYILTQSSKDVFTHEWKNTYQTIYTIEGEYEARIEQDFDNGLWVNNTKILNKSTNEGAYRIDFEWNSINNTWVNDRRSTSHMNTDSTEHTFTAEYFRDEEWHMSYMKEIWYNSFGTDTLQIVQRTRDGELTNDIRTRSIYDENDYLSSRLKYEWNNEQNSWNNNTRYDYEVDSSFMFNLMVYYSGNDSSWAPQYKEESIYNEQHQMTSLIRSFYLAETNLWDPSMKYTREYQEELLIFNRMFFWQDSLWLATDYIGYEYDDLDRLVYRYCNSPNYPRDKTDYEYMDTDDHHFYSWHRQTYHRDDSLWLNAEKNVEYRNKHITKTDELPINSFKLYPNPSSDFIIIESEVYHSHKTNYEIIDIQGRIIDSDRLAPNGYIDVKHLKVGVYFIRVYSPDGKALTLEFIKQ